MWGAGDTLPLCRPRGEEGWVGVRSTRALVHRPYLAVGVRRQPHSSCRTSSITRVVSVRAWLSSCTHSLWAPLTRVAFFLPPPTFHVFPLLGCNGRCRRRLLLHRTCSTSSLSRAWRSTGRGPGRRPRRHSRRCPSSRAGQAILLLRLPLPRRRPSRVSVKVSRCHRRQAKWRRWPSSPVGRRTSTGGSHRTTLLPWVRGVICSQSASPFPTRSR